MRTEAIILAALERFTFITLRDLRVVTGLAPRLLRTACYRLRDDGLIKRTQGVRKAIRGTGPMWLYALPHHEPMVKPVPIPAWEARLIAEEVERKQADLDRRAARATQRERGARHLTMRSPEECQRLRAMWEKAALETVARAIESAVRAST